LNVERRESKNKKNGSQRTRPSTLFGNHPGRVEGTPRREKTRTGQDRKKTIEPRRKFTQLTSLRGKRGRPNRTPNLFGKRGRGRVRENTEKKYEAPPILNASEKQKTQVAQKTAELAKRKNRKKKNGWEKNATTRSQSQSMLLTDPPRKTKNEIRRGGMWKTKKTSLSIQDM